MTDKKDEPGKAGQPSGGATSGPQVTSGAQASSGSQASSGATGSSGAQGMSGPAGAKPGDAKPADPKAIDPKRPAAVIDAKAVELSSTPIKPAATASDAAAKAGAAATAGKPNDPKSDPKAAIKPDAKSTNGQPQPAKSAPAPRRSSGIGAVFSHLIAGVVGGATAWYGATALGPELGLLPPNPNGFATKVLEDKVAVLERRASAQPAAAPVAASPEVLAKLAAAEAEIAKLREASKAVGDLSAAQTRLSSDVKATEAVRQQAEADAAQRIAKLEERLKLMSDAAGEPSAGKLPQLAAVSGRIVDLEATLTNQLSALRRTVSQELENRLASTNETSEAAKSGTNRVDREVSKIKSDTAALTGRLDGIKAETDRVIAAVQGIREETGTIKTTVDALRADLDAKYKASAKPADVAAAIAPVASKVASLEQGLQTVVKSEDERKATGERVVLALELNNLKRVVDRGQKYASELDAVRKVAGGKVDLTVLDRHKDTGLPTLSDLTRDVRTAANAMLASLEDPTDGSMLDRMLAGAKSVVRVRKVDHAPDDMSVEAIIGRVETALKDGRVADAAVASRALDKHPKAAAAGQSFLLKLEARAAVDAAIAGLEAALKSSLAQKPTN